MVVVSLCGLGRLYLSQRWSRRIHKDVTASHVLMGVAMAGMLVPSWNVVPDAIWEPTFAAIALYFLVSSAWFIARHGLDGTDVGHVHHVSHYSIHMVMACAMLYMYWLGMPVTTPSSTTMSMSGPPSGVGDPGLTFFLIVVLLASAVWQVDSIGRFATKRAFALEGTGLTSQPGARSAVGPEFENSELAPQDQIWLAPRLQIASHIAMCLAMAYLLVLMV